ncbi:OmpA family protein [Desulfoglaeba alkanexedens]|nr:OmpA family protein [Desulfoglaeba alkanexedens]
MTRYGRKLFFIGLALACLLATGVPAAQAKMVPKVDNFIFFVDQSGSMYMTHGKMGKVKMVLAQELLLMMNEKIPELGYKGALDLFAPWQVVADPAVYERNAYGKALSSIPTDQGVFNRRTPMGPGINRLDTVLAGLTGKTAVIIVSDGEANVGTDPVAEAYQVHAKYPDVCFHVISFAEKPHGEQILKKINGMGDCVWADAETLMADEAAMNQFVRDVFYDEVAEAARAVSQVVILRGIQFDFDKSDIKPEWEPVLDEGVNILKENPAIRIIIEGHTCDIGTDAYNQGLSERRARSVYEYFMKEGISPSRMRTVGYGEMKPKASNATEDGRIINRRVEIRVVE